MRPTPYPFGLASETSSSSSASSSRYRASARSSSEVSWSRVSSVPSRKCRRSSGAVRVLTWNLYHGRSPTAVGALAAERVRRRARGWAWDVALLQEVPPWWPPMLARAAARSSARGSPRATGCCRLRRAVSARNPDVLKSGGGGGERDPRARPRSSSTARCGCGGVPEGRVGARRAGSRTRLGGQRPLAEPARGARARRHASDAIARGPQLGRGDAPLILGGDVNLKRPPELPGLVRRRRQPRRPPVHRRPARGRQARGARARAAVRPPAGRGHARLIECTAQCAADR